MPVREADPQGTACFGSEVLVSYFRVRPNAGPIGVPIKSQVLASHTAQDLALVARRAGLLAGCLALTMAGLAIAQNIAPAQGFGPPAVGPLRTIPGFVGVGGPADAPPKEPIVPLSGKLGVQLVNVPSVDLLPINLGAVLIEDAAETTGRIREGVGSPLSFDFDPAMGGLYEVPGGGWLWALDVRAPGSFGVRIHFADFQLPAGAQAIVYDPQIPDNLPDPYSTTGPLNNGDFWAWTSWSDTARVEVYLPPEVAADRFNQFFRIDQALHIYRNPTTGLAGAYGDRELPCHNDLECFSNWTQAGAGVGRMQFTIGSSGFACSGAMLNNLGGDLTPYFMTARHCMQDNSQALGSLQVYWFFQRAGCAGAVPGIGSVPRSDRCNYVRTDNSTDMSLVMIEGTVPRTLWWMGNDSASQPDGAYAVGIHHPAGTHKRISFGNGSGYSVSCGASGLQFGSNVDYYSGTVEPGSSGSPLMTGNAGFIGVASCGPSGGGVCPGFLTEGVYGKWFVGYGAFQEFVNNAAYDDGNENNDSCGSATNLNSYGGNGTVYSQYLKVYDQDWFRLTVPAFGSCTFRSVFTHADGDIDMNLHDGCGGVLASSGGTANSETITWNNSTSSPREVYLNVFLYNDTRNIYYLDFSRVGVSAPSNDACFNATSIPAGGQGSNASGGTTGATTDGSTNCTTSSADVWFRIVAPCTRTVSLNTQFSNFDTVLSVHTGCPGTAANQVACNDDVVSGTLWSSLSFTANGGQNYYVRLAGYQGAFGSYNLDSNYGYASNDLCSATANIPAGSYAFNTCTCETDGPPDDACLAFGSNQIYNDFWLGYTPTCDGILELNTVGSNFDTKVAIYANPDNSSCPSGPNSAIACNDDISQFDLQSRTSVPCTAGQRYILRIGSYDTNVRQAGIVNIIFTPANNACASALAVSDGATAICTTGATTDGPDEPNACNFAQFTQVGADIWYSYTASCLGTVTVDLCDADYDSKVAVYSGTACPTGPGTALTCNDDACGGTGLSSIVSFPAQAGEAFMIRVGGYGSGTDQATMVISCAPTTCSPDFDGDGDAGTDLDIEAFFACLGGDCCATCGASDFDGDGDAGTDLDIESFFRVLGGGAC